ncbi:MAG TPA: DJ-1/PfpI family protein [Stenomitos sp.]
MAIVGKTVAVLGTVDRDDPVLARLRTRLRAAGARVLVIGDRKVAWSAADLSVSEAREIWFDALVIPSGPYVSRFTGDEDALELVTQFEIDAKPIAAMGRGLLVLTAAELVAGRRLAVDPAIGEQVAEQGGRVSDASLVEDEMWITAQDATGLEELLDRLVESMRRIHLAARDASAPLDD